MHDTIHIHKRIEIQRRLPLLQIITFERYIKALRFAQHRSLLPIVSCASSEAVPFAFSDRYDSQTCCIAPWRLTTRKLSDRTVKKGKITGKDETKAECMTSWDCIENKVREQPERAHTASRNWRKPSLNRWIAVSAKTTERFWALTVTAKDGTKTTSFGHT